MKKLPITEQSSLYDNLESMSISDILSNINKEDKKVSDAVKRAIPTISSFVEALIPRVEAGGRLFYIGAGTSGRLGILDASECPPTFGVSDNVVIGLIAGGDSAIRKAVEFAEDDRAQAWEDLKKHDISDLDSVVAIASSGTTPYVIGGLKRAQENNCLTACISCNVEAPIYQYSDHKIKLIVGSEFITGSTRMKSGTAQKMALNMISTSLMIGLGRVKGNRMIDMQLSNKKLVERGIRMIMNQTNMTRSEAEINLKKHGNVRSVLNKYK